MSQVSSSTVINTIKNSGNNNSTWNRTPGKPGVGSGTGHITGGCNTTSTTTTTTINSLVLSSDNAAAVATVALPKTNGPTADLVYPEDFVPENRRTGAFSIIGDGDSPSLTFPLEESLDQPDFTDPSIPPLGSGQMWPPPIFETPDGITSDSKSGSINTSAPKFTSHPDDAVGVASSQWSIAPQTNTPFTDPSQAIAPTTGVWSLDASTAGANSSTGPSSTVPVPRAITGQMHQPTSGDSLLPAAGPGEAYSSRAKDATATRGVSAVWSTGNLNEHSQMLTGDQSTLPSAFSKLHLTGATGQSDCFQPIHDFSDGQPMLQPSISSAISQPGSESDLHPGSLASKGCDKKSSVDNSEVDVMYTPDPEEAIQAIVNSTEPWGQLPIDQSSPWDLSELSCATSGGTGGTGSGDPLGGQSGLDCTPLPSGDAVGRTIFDGQQATSSTSSARRVGATGSCRGDFESNVWPREPPNGTGIWEAHYESLGERTARWQQHTSVNMPQQPVASGPQHSGQQFSQLPSSGVSAGRSHFTGAAASPAPEGASSALFSGYPGRPSGGMSSLSHPMPGAAGSTGGPLGGNNRSIAGGSGMMQMHLDSLHSNGSSHRNFPMGSSSAAWMHGSGAGVLGSGSGNVMGGAAGMDQKSSRWPGNSNVSRISSKQQQQQQHQSFQSMLSVTGGGGAPSANHQMPSGWPPTDPRHAASNRLSMRWSSTGGSATPGLGDNAGTAGGSGTFYGVASPMHPLISSPSMPPPAPRGFRPPLPVPHHHHQQQQQQSHGAFFQSSAIGGPSSSVSSQRAGLLSTQQQLQQQSVLRANAMRQMISMGFSEEEVHAIFSDVNTNIPRALLELRERTCHSGLDDIIRMFTNTNSCSGNNNSNNGAGSAAFFPMSGGDDLGAGELASSGSTIARIISARYGLSMPDHQQQQQQLTTKINSQMGGTGCAPSTENVDAALTIMRQKEAQILQTIVQLNNKRVELMAVNARQPNMQVPSGFIPVLNELLQQEILVRHQISAQEVQLRHIRRQAEMLKQLTINSPSPPPLSHQMGGGVAGATSSNFPPGAVGGGPAWQGNACLSGASSLVSGLMSSTAGVDMVASGTGPSGISDVQQLLLQQMGMEAGGGYQEQAQGSSGGGSANAALNMGSGSFLWESGPWSGAGQSSSQDGYSSFNTVGGPNATNVGAAGGSGGLATDRRSWSTNRASQPGFPTATTSPSSSSTVNTLGADPRWLMESSVGAAGGPLGVPDDEYSEGAGGSRHWLLVHNIPPHMSVSVIKAAVASALAKSTAAIGEQAQCGTAGAHLDFELHPNMSARWVLLGMNSAASANSVLDYLDGCGGGSGGQLGSATPSNGGGHYGCIKTISTVEAFQRLQDIQSLACRLKGLAADNSTALGGVPSGSGHGFIRSVNAHQQPASQLPFSVTSDLSMHDGTAGLFPAPSACDGAGLGGN